MRGSQPRAAPKLPRIVVAVKRFRGSTQSGDAIDESWLGRS